MLGPDDPQRVGAYRLLGRLGAGGMGQVYLARSERGSIVAVKVVRQELAAHEEFRRRFEQEVQASRRVGGAWTAAVLDADTEASTPWVATGYLAGPTLQQVISRDYGALPEPSVRILAAGLAYALRDIHAAGLIHRDLKPSNILVTPDGPRVIDFGIARAMETVMADGLTRTGAQVGSPGFMAPEQVRGDPITPACDVFSLGSVVAYAATGRLPFGTTNSGVHAVMFRIAQEEPDLTDIPAGLRNLVWDCLHKRPADRPTLDQILERIGAEDLVGHDGNTQDQWLPDAMTAHLGRYGARLLAAAHLDQRDESPPPPRGRASEDDKPTTSLGQGSLAQGTDGGGPQSAAAPHDLQSVRSMLPAAGRALPPVGLVTAVLIIGGLVVAGLIQLLRILPDGPAWGWALPLWASLTVAALVVARRRRWVNGQSAPRPGRPVPSRTQAFKDGLHLVLFFPSSFTTRSSASATTTAGRTARAPSQDRAWGNVEARLLKISKLLETPSDGGTSSDNGRRPGR